MLAVSKFAKESFLLKKSFAAAAAVADDVDVDGGGGAITPNGSVFCRTGAALSLENGDGFDKLRDEDAAARGGDVRPNDDDDDVEARSEEAAGVAILIGGGVAVCEGFAIAADAGGGEFLCICKVEPISPDENFEGGE